MTIKVPLITLVIAAIGFGSCKQNQQATVAAAPGAINVDTLSYETALKYVSNYEKRAGKVDSVYLDDKGVEKHKSLPNTRAIWFSKARIHTIDSIMNAENGDGVRFYLAAYDTATNAHPVLRAHQPGYTTLVLVMTKDSTGKDSKKYHHDFYTSKVAGQNGPVQNFIVGAPPQNRGEQCPPPSTCSTIGATLIP